MKVPFVDITRAGEYGEAGFTQAIVDKAHCNVKAVLNQISKSKRFRYVGKEFIDQMVVGICPMEDGHDHITSFHLYIQQLQRSVKKGDVPQDYVNALECQFNEVTAPAGARLALINITDCLDVEILHKRLAKILGEMYKSSIRGFPLNMGYVYYNGMIIYAFDTPTYRSNNPHGRPYRKNEST